MNAIGTDMMTDMTASKAKELADKKNSAQQDEDSKEVKDFFGIFTLKFVKRPKFTVDTKLNISSEKWGWHVRTESSTRRLLRHWNPKDTKSKDLLNVIRAAV